MKHVRVQRIRLQCARNGRCPGDIKFYGGGSLLDGHAPGGGGGGGGGVVLPFTENVRGGDKQISGDRCISCDVKCTSRHSLLHRSPMASTTIYEWRDFKWKNPRFCAPVPGEYCSRIDMDLMPPESTQWYPFTLCRTDTGAMFDTRELYDQVIAHGGISPYVPPTAEEVARSKREMMYMERHKFKFALYSAGKLDAAKHALAQAPMDVQFEWDDAPTVSRLSAVVSCIQGALGLSDEEVDAFFPEPMHLPV